LRGGQRLALAVRQRHQQPFLPSGHYDLSNRAEAELDDLPRMLTET
jgi:hypothetical protein